MGIKVFRIVLDGVVHEVEVEEIHRESRGGGQTAQGKTVGAEDGETRNRRPPGTAEAVSQNRPAGGAGAAAVQKGAFAGTERITAPLPVSYTHLDVYKRQGPQRWRQLH